MKRLALAMLALAGCVEPRTEVVVVVHSYGLVIGRDVDAVQIIVKNRPDANDETEHIFTTDKHLLCADTPVPSCWTLPVTATLVPGPNNPDDLVVVKVLGVRAGNQVIGNQASFRFLKHVSQRLDFVLYANCLNVDCSVQNAACNYAGMCEAIQPMTFEGEPQLDGPPAHLLPDLAGGGGAVDMAGRDLAGVLPDLSQATQNDMSVSTVDDLSIASMNDLLMPDLLLPDLLLPDLRQPDLRQPDLSSFDLAYVDLAGEPDMATGDDMAVPPWTSVGPALSPTIALRAVWGLSGGALDTDNVFVVGDQGTILHSANSGNSWTAETGAPNVSLFAVWGEPTGDTIFAAGNDGTLLKRNLNGTWSQTNNPWDAPANPMINMRGVWGDDPSGFFTVGNGFTLGTWDGANWQQLCGSGTAESFHAASGADKQSLLVVGNNGSGGGLVNRWFNTACVPVNDMGCAPSCPLMTIHSGGAELFGVSNHLVGGYAVGRSGTILNCSGGGCSGESTPSLEDLWAAWSAPDGMFNLVVGSNGTIHRKQPATSVNWVSENSGVSVQLNGVWGGSGGSNQAYAVGAAGTIIRRN